MTVRLATTLQAAVRVRVMILLLIVMAICLAPLVLGYKLVAGAVSVRAANGVLLLVAGAVMTVWFVGNLSFDAGV